MKSAIKILFLLLISFLFDYSLANQNTPNEEENILFYSDEKQSQNTKADPEVDVQLDIKNESTGNQETTDKFDRELFYNKTLNKLNDSTQLLSSNEHELPNSLLELNHLMKLSDQEITLFLERKKKHLNNFLKFLTFIKLSEARVNSIMFDLNSKFYDSSHIISKSNTTQGTYMLSLSGGLALPQLFMAKIKDHPISKFIPQSGGFYYLLGIGIGVGRRIDKSGKSRFVIDIFVDVEKLKSTVSGLLEVSIANNFGIVFEKRGDYFKRNHSNTYYGGPAGVFKQGAHQFGWNGSAGLSLPPGIGIFLLYTDKTERYYILRLEDYKLSSPVLNDLRKYLLKFVPSFATKKVRRQFCSKIFFTT